MKKKAVLTLSLRPYAGRVYATSSKEEFERRYRLLFGKKHVIDEGTLAQCATGSDGNGRWVALVYATTADAFAHEFSHVLFALFDRNGIPLNESTTEPFAYQLSQLMEDTSSLYAPKLSKTGRKPK